MVRFSFWVFLFENVFSPKGWRKKSSKWQNSKMFGSYRLYNGFNNFHMQIQCKNSPDAFEHVPDLFWRSLGPEIWVRDPGLENSVQVLFNLVIHECTYIYIYVCFVNRTSHSHSCRFRRSRSWSACPRKPSVLSQLSCRPRPPQKLEHQRQPLQYRLYGRPNVIIYIYMYIYIYIYNIYMYIYIYIYIYA